MKKILLVIFFSLGISMPSIASVFLSRAHAATNCVKSNASGMPSANCVPSWVINDINQHCNIDHWGIVSDSWFSAAGNPSSTTVNVTQGDTSINLDLNYIFYRCVVNPSRYFTSAENGISEKNYFSSDSKNNGSITNLPASFAGTYPSPLIANTYNQGVISTVKYSPSSSFQVSATRNIYLDSRGYFTDSTPRGNVSYCSWVTPPEVILNNGVSGTGNRTPNSDASNCATQIAAFSINVVVKSIIVQGTVYGHTSGAVNVSTGAGVTKLTGVTLAGVDKCGNGTATTNTSGSYSFTSTIGNAFCIRAPLKFITNKIEYSNLKIIPFGSSVTNCDNNSVSYEYQYANIPHSTPLNFPLCDYKLPGNNGYDFLYQTSKRASVTTTGSVSVAKAYAGQRVTFTNTITSSQTLPDDGSDSYSYSVADVNRNLPTPSSGSCTASATTVTLIPEGTKTVTCTITIPSTMSAGTNLCTQVGVSNGPSYLYVNGVLGGNGNVSSCVSVLAPPTMTISVPSDYEINSDNVAPTTNPGTVVKTLSVGYVVNCNSYTGSLTIQISAPSSFPNQSATVTCASTGQSLSGSWNVWNSGIDSYPPGQYVFTGSITGGTPSGVPLPPTIPVTANPGTLQIYTVPYARFYGNDIYSGGSVTFNTKNSLNTGTDGSAGQYAIIAKGVISMASAAYRSGQTSPGLNGLSASLATAATQPTAGTQGSGSAVNWSASGYYGDPANDILLSGQSSVNKKITVVGKDVYINENITVGSIPSPFDDASTPVVLIISANNIYINSSVTRIDALLQAGKDVYTCNNSLNSSNPAVNCTQKLIVNGSIGAGGSIHFGRSTGTRLLATANEDSIPSVPSGALLISTQGAAAEVINFPSYLYFASPYITTSSSTRYDALYSVAPLL